MSDTGSADKCCTDTTPTPSSGPLHEAPLPFNKANADVILRTPDRIDFCVFKCILEEVSPVFCDMFKLPPSPDLDSGVVGTQGTLEGGPSTTTSCVHVPIVDVSEHSTVLEPLLRSFWPPANYVPSSLDTFKPVIAAAHKYQMHSVLAIFEERLGAFATRAPIRVYAIAVVYGMPDAMYHAALAFLALSPAHANECVDELQNITGKDYHRMLAYRRRCVAALREMLDDLTWLRERRRLGLSQLQNLQEAGRAVIQPARLRNPVLPHCVDGGAL
ncbi:hypothetical protein C8Q80DRAFT_124729 [Daedaleopsis nitida]|nr:hypothetical protein C8Q80DRAFT_124729 [Daedaleopsis nitida]